MGTSITLIGPRAGEHIIDDSFRNNDVLFPTIDGEVKGRGQEPRDYSIFPEEMYATPPKEMKLVPKNEYDARLEEQVRTKGRMSDILLLGDKGKPIPSLDQGPNGYCWGHSTTGALQTVRAIRNELYVPLSAYMVCSIIKKGANQGGWCGESGKFLEETGTCSQKLWPQGNRDYRKLDTPEVRAEAKQYRVTESWMDLARAVHAQRLTFEQVATCCLLGWPMAGDFNWWGHSVLLLDLVKIESGSYGIRFRNSWGDQWGDRGFGILRDSKARPDGALALRSSAAA